MDQESIVYGCIKDSIHDSEQGARTKANRRAMLSLPSAEEWPFLCKEMFSIPKITNQSGYYQTEVMHFGASYKAVEYEWKQWIAQFEALLSKMYWISATVHLETELNGTHIFTWETDNNYHEPGNGNINVRCEWSRENVLM